MRRGRAVTGGYMANVFYDLTDCRTGGQVAVLADEGISRIVSNDFQAPVGACCYRFPNAVLMPGLADVHVHLREPGFCYKETVETGTLAAARGGYTDVCSMPNLKPVPDSREHLAVQQEAIDSHACIRVHPYGAISVDEMGQELSDMEGLADAGVIAFSDDGRGVQSGNMMRLAMIRARSLGKVIAAHCEDNSLLTGICVHDGAFARSLGLKGIGSDSEWVQIERDLKLAEETGCAYHVCHISCRRSVELIRAAKARGVDVTCETAPHYLVFCEDDLRDEGGFRMNPPIRTRDDMEALIEGLADGTVDMIATDHAPHSAEEKSGGLGRSLNGIVGLETAFPVLYTALVQTGKISITRLIKAMSDAPRRRFGIETPENDFTVFDLGTRYTIDPDGFMSKGRSTPFAGMEVSGKCLLTVCGGNEVWRDLTTEN